MEGWLALVCLTVQSMSNLEPIVIDNVDNVLAITVVKQVLGKLAPYFYFNWYVLLIEKARLIVHFILRPIFFPILQHIANYFLYLLSTLPLTLPR